MSQSFVFALGVAHMLPPLWAQMPLAELRAFGASSATPASTDQRSMSVGGGSGGESSTDSPADELAAGVPSALQVSLPELMNALQVNTSVVANVRDNLLAIERLCTESAVQHQQEQQQQQQGGDGLLFSPERHAQASAASAQRAGRILLLAGQARTDIEAMEVVGVDLATEAAFLSARNQLDAVQDRLRKCLTALTAKWPPETIFDDVRSAGGSQEGGRYTKGGNLMMILMRDFAVAEAQQAGDATARAVSGVVARQSLQSKLMQRQQSFESSRLHRKKSQRKYAADLDSLQQVWRPAEVSVGETLAS